MSIVTDHRYWHSAVVLIAAALLNGCANAPVGPAPYLHAQSLPVVPQRPDQAQNGSVFSPEEHVSLFQDHRLWRAGDLVTIDIAQNASASTNDGSQVQRQATTNTNVSAFLGVPLTVGHSGGQPFSPSFGTSDDTNFKGQGQTSASNTIQGQVTAVVTQIEPNGVLAVRGKTNVNINGDLRSIAITGFARPQDIGPDNSISSNELAGMNIQYVGEGPTQTAHHVPWLQNFINHDWPF